MRHFVFLIGLCLVFSLNFAHAQEPPSTAFAAGDWIVTLTAVDVYTQPASGNRITTMPWGSVTLASHGPVMVDGVNWWYVNDNGFGWIPEHLDGHPVFRHNSALYWNTLVEETTSQITTAPTADAYARRAMAHFFFRDYDAGTQDFTSAITIDSSVQWYYAMRGKLYMDWNQTALADLDLEQAIRMDPTDTMAYIRLAIVWEKQSQFQKAIDVYLEQIQRLPDYGLLYLNAGNVYRRMNQIDTAQTYLDQSLQVDPQMSFAYVSKAIIANSRGRVNDAIDWYTQAIAVNPYDDDAYVGRGTRYHEMGNISNAIADYQRAIEVAPYNSNGYSALGILYSMEGSPAEARLNLQQAVTLNPMDFEAHYNLAANLAMFYGDYEEALIQYQLADETGTFFDTTIPLYRGQVLMILGRYDEAVLDLGSYSYSCCSTFLPNIFGPTGNLGFAAARVHLKEFDNARFPLIDAFDTNYNYALNYTEWGRPYRVVQDHEVYIAVKQAEINADPTNPDLVRELASLQFEGGYWQDAIDSFNQYMEMTPDLQHDSLVELLEILSGLLEHP